MTRKSLTTLMALQVISFAFFCSAGGVNISSPAKTQTGTTFRSGPGFASGSKHKDSPLDVGTSGLVFSVSYGMPSGDVGLVFNSALSFEAGYIIRQPFPGFFLPIDLQLSAEYESYSGRVFSADSFTVISPRLFARYSFTVEQTPGLFFVMLGGGVAFESATVAASTTTNTDPVVEFAGGYEMQLVEKVNLQFSLDYEWIMEKYISGAARDGTFIKLKAGINYIL